MAAALLAGCGGSQPPVGVPGAMSQTRALNRPSGCGTVYSISRRGKETLLHSFLGAPDHDGCAAEAPLTDVNGMLYGTTEFGGGHGGRFGVVYRISTEGVETIVYRFGSGFGDARDPKTGLVDVNGTLYGTTRHGGTGRCRDHGCGTVYSISQSGKEKVLYSFGSDGCSPCGDAPHGGLIAVNRTLYGTTSLGGPGGSGSCNKGCGTVYSTTTHGKETVLYDFAGGSDAEHPVAGLIDVNGTLYGTTVWGGGSKNCSPKGCGTIYSVSTSGVEQVLHSFSNADGENPKAALINVKGTLYGTTEAGGANGDGTVFSITPSGTETVLHSFGGSEDGAFPRAGLLNVNGTLYGTTEAGGTNDDGTVFSITLSGTETVLHSFGGGSGDGASPQAGLINVNGTLYGTTYAGGVH